MSQLPSVSPSAPNPDPSVAPAEPGFEVRAQAFWDKNRSAILLICTLVLIVIVAREGWQYFAAMRERGVQEEYARIADQPEKLPAFAAEHGGHPLAGVALLRVADQKFEAGDYGQAATAYNSAAASLKNEALLGRAKLGAAISQLQGADKAAGETALKAISADTSLIKSVRAEANYHLASIAYADGKTEDVKKLVEEITKLDLNGAWAQRGTMLLATLSSSAEAATAATPTFSLKPSGN